MMTTAAKETQPPYPGSVSGLVSKAVFPYMGVQFDRTRTYENGRTLRIITSQAYNALGLIGPEFNGVAILDEDRREVVCDCLAENPQGGYFGVSQEAWNLAWKLYTGSWEQVCRYVNASPRRRRERFE